MNKCVLVVAAVALCAQKSIAGGFDGISIGVNPLFEPGRYAEITYNSLHPNIRGADNQNRNYSNVTPSLENVNGAFKFDFNERWSMAFLSDEPYQRDTVYSKGPAKGLKAAFKSRAWTVLGRYKITHNFSVFGGPIAQTLELSSDAPFAGYTVRTDADTDFGYAAGIAYEIPKSPTRVTLSYRSEIEHHMDAREYGQRSTVVQKTPQQLNLDMQAPVSDKVVLFGGIRWGEWSKIDVAPPILKVRTGRTLREYKKNTFRYTLGASYRATDRALLSVWASHEPDKEPNFSSIAPTDGSTDLGIGLTYNLGGGLKVRPSVVYRKYGDISDPVYGEYTDNFLTLYSLKVSYSF